MWILFQAEHTDIHEITDLKIRISLGGNTCLSLDWFQDSSLDMPD